MGIIGINTNNFSFYLFIHKCNRTKHKNKNKMVIRFSTIKSEVRVWINIQFYDLNKFLCWTLQFSWRPSIFFGRHDQSNQYLIIWSACIDRYKKTRKLILKYFSRCILHVFCSQDSKAGTKFFAQIKKKV